MYQRELVCRRRVLQLAEQAGRHTGESQWCYQRNKSGLYAEGMVIPVDVLRAHRLSPANGGRMGIRLPSWQLKRADITAFRSIC